MSNSHGETTARGSEMLREWRRRAKMSQRALAMRAGLTQSQVSLFETEVHTPDLQTAITLEEVCGIPPRAWKRAKASARKAA